MLHLADSVAYYNDKEKCLVDYATSLNTYLDPWLEDSFPGGARSQLLPFIASLITECVDSRPSNRPSMLQLLESLERLAVSCGGEVVVDERESAGVGENH
ncbi:hypothetical protein AgCh_002733 [Apium graveolens]